MDQGGETVGQSDKAHRRHRGCGTCQKITGHSLKIPNIPRNPKDEHCRHRHQSAKIAFEGGGGAGKFFVETAAVVSQREQYNIRHSQKCEGVLLKRSEKITMKKVMDRTLYAAAWTFVASEHIQPALRKRNFARRRIVYTIKIDAPCGKHHTEGNQ